MKKRILALTLALVLCAAMVPTVSLAADDETVSEGEWSAKSWNDMWYITSGPKSGGVVIPTTVAGKPVSGVWTEAFYNTDITSLVVPGSVKDLRNYAFAGCKSLTKVTLEEGVESLYYGTFSGSGFTTIQLPSTLNCIGEDTFAGSKLTEIVIPGSVPTISSYAFSGCTNLKTVYLSEGVKEIGTRTFHDCTSLTDLYIPSSVRRIVQYKSFSMGISDTYPIPGLTLHCVPGSEGEHYAKEVCPMPYKTDYSSYTPGGGASAAPVIISKGTNPSDTGIAGQSTQTVTVGDKKVELQAYKLASPDGDTNYVKIRDVAAALDGTAAQFNVGWDGAVNLEKGKAYTDRNGQENKTPYSGDRAYEKSTAATKVNGVTVELQAFIIKDDEGKGSTYYKLRDLGQALGFNVGFSGERGIYIEPDKAYDQGD